MSSQPPRVTGHHKDTVRRIFAHPLSHNLEWHDVVSLLREITTVDDRSDGGIEVTAEGSTLVLAKPHGKDLGVDEVIELRHLLQRMGYEEDDV